MVGFDDIRLLHPQVWLRVSHTFLGPASEIQGLKGTTPWVSEQSWKNKRTKFTPF